MKKVHSTKQLAHLYCNMIDSHLEGFKNSGRSVFVENGVMYSYGYHYPMAKKYQTGTGENHREVILINSNKSSVTTEKHKSILSAARKPNQWRFWVPNIKDPRDPENLIELENDIVDAVDAVIRGLKYHAHYDINAAIERYNQYAQVFKLKPFKGLDQDFNFDLIMLDRKNSERLKRLEETKSEREIKRREAAVLKNTEIINRTHSNLHLWYSNDDHDLKPRRHELDLLSNKMQHDLIRVKNSETVETHRGAEVPFSEAWILLQAVMSKGVVYVINKKIGHFTINQTENKPDGDVILTIGCHKISMKQSMQAFQHHIDMTKKSPIERMMFNHDGK